MPGWAIFALGVAAGGVAGVAAAVVVIFVVIGAQIVKADTQD